MWRGGGWDTGGPDAAWSGQGTCEGGGEQCENAAGWQGGGGGRRGPWGTGESVTADLRGGGRGGGGEDAARKGPRNTARPGGPGGVGGPGGGWDPA